MTVLESTTVEESTTLEERSIGYRQQGWSLKDLLEDPSPTAIQGRLLALEEATAAFETHRAVLDEEMAPEVFLSLLKEYEALVEAINIISAYGHLWFSADTQSADALGFLNRTEHLLTQISNRTLFFSLWWKALPDETAHRLLPSGEENSDYRHYLLDWRRWRPYTLSEDAEKIINIKDADGVDGITTLYSILTNRLEFELEIDGERQKVNRDKLMSYAYSPQAAVRAAAYQELYRVYAEESTVLGQIYTYRVRDWHNENVGLRGFTSPIAVRNTDNDVPNAAVETLLEVTRDNRGLFQDYFRLKARLLGMERLRRYDIYAPLAESNEELPWNEAIVEVLQAFHNFHPRVADLAERVFAEDHIDSEVRKGKRGGAFCSTVLPRITPWVMVGFTGRVRDVAELAHELGHAVHSMLAGHHSVLTQNPCLPLAETASVFSEMLVTDRLLTRVTDPLARRELLSKALGDVYATVLRQAYFVRFELEAHQAILDGASIGDLSDRYLANLQEQFGDSVEVSDEFRHEWLSIPHLYSTPFYCYAYSFGQLLVLALYRRYQQEGEAFIPSYLRMLSYGGAARPQEILREAGIDMTDRGFWQGGFEVVRRMLQELEESAP
jgi:oligoendopeptidase F